jgi:hypothetical protein
MDSAKSRCSAAYQELEALNTAGTEDDQIGLAAATADEP